jgi:CHAT domain-containing protein
MGTEKDLARGNRDDWKPSNAFWQQSQIAVRTDLRLTGERIEPKTTWLSERQRKRKEKQSKTFQPIPAHLSSKEAIEAYVGAMRKPVPTDEAALKLKEEKTPKEKTDEPSTGTPTLIASESSMTSQTSEKEQKTNTDQDKKTSDQPSTVDAQKARAEKLLDEGQVDKAVETLDQAMTQDFMTKHGKEVKNNNPISIQAMQKRLKDADKKAGTKSAVVYMHLREKRGLDLIVLTASGKPVHKFVDVESTTLKRNKGEARKQFFDDQFDFTSKADKPLKNLYRDLITPVEGLLPKNGNVMFAVDKDLQSVPFAALMKPDDNSDKKVQRQGDKELLNRDKPYLVKDFAISMIPSLHAIDTNYKSLKDLPVSAMGASSFKESSNLRAIPTELDQTTRMTGTSSDDGKFTLNENFNLSTLQSAKNPLIHVASHGTSTAILTSDPRNNIEIKDIQKIKWEQTPDLLTLSGCLGALTTEEGSPYGLAGAAVSSGAKSVAGATWAGDDNSTMTTITSLYHNLQKTGMTKAEALRKTQLGLLNGKIRFTPDGKSLIFDEDKKEIKITDPNFQKAIAKTEDEFSQLSPQYRKENETPYSWPHYWAPFILFGSPW